MPNSEILNQDRQSNWQKHPHIQLLIDFICRTIEFVASAAPRDSAWRERSQHMAALINGRQSPCLGPSRQFRSDRTCGPCFSLGFAGRSSVLCSLSWISEHCSLFSWAWVGLKIEEFFFFGFLSLVGLKNQKQTVKKRLENLKCFLEIHTVMEILFLGNHSALWNLDNVCFCSFVVFFLYVHIAYMHFWKYMQIKMQIQNKRFYSPEKWGKNRRLRGYLESRWTRGKKNKKSNTRLCIFFPLFVFSTSSIFCFNQQKNYDTQQTPGH